MNQIRAHTHTEKEQLQQTFDHTNAELQQKILRGIDLCRITSKLMNQSERLADAEDDPPAFDACRTG